MKVFLIVMLLLCTGLSLMARADIAITFGAPGGGDELTIMTVIGQKAAMGMKSPDGRDGRLVYDADADKLLMVMDGEKQYMDMDQMMQQMSGLSNMLSGMMQNMPEGTKSKLQGLFGEGKKNQPDQAQMVKTGKNDNVAGIDCEIVQFSSAMSSSELCLADPGDAGITTADFRVLKGMMEKQQQMAQKASQMMGAGSMSFGPTDMNQIPVRSRQLSGPAAGTTMELVGVFENVDPAATNIPADYQPMAMPGG